MNNKHPKKTDLPQDLEQFPAETAQELIREGVEKRDLVEERRESVAKQVEETYDLDDESRLGYFLEPGDEIWVTVSTPSHLSVRTKFNIKSILHERLVDQGHYPLNYLLQPVSSEDESRVRKVLGLEESGKYQYLYDPEMKRVHCTPLQSNGPEQVFSMEVNRLMKYKKPKGKNEPKTGQKPLKFDEKEKVILYRTNWMNPDKSDD